MTKTIDPRIFGLPPRTILRQVDADHIAIVIRRKSRIVMKDGQKILEKADKIRTQKEKTRVSLITTAPVCGKTMRFLSVSGIETVQESDGPS